MHNTKKVISIVLVAAMLLTVMAVGVVSANAVTGRSFFLTGTIAGWGMDEKYIMTKTDDPDHEEYVIENVTIQSSDLIKAIKSSKSGEDIDSWYPDGMDNNRTVEKSGIYNVYLRPNGDGDETWEYIPHIGDDSGEDPHGCTNGGYMFKFELVQEIEPEVLEYYLIGSMNSWSVDAAYKLTKNDEAEAEEYLLYDVALKASDEFKVVASPDGETKKVWYPDGMENCKVAADGTYDVYVRPNGDGGEDWFKGTIYCDGPKTVEDPTQEATPDEATPDEPTITPTEEPSEEATPDEPTIAPTEEPIAGSDYFLVGSFSGWEVLPQYNFAHSVTDEDVEEYVITVQLEEGATFKAVKGNKEAWYPDGMGNDCKAEVAGEYTIYLRPNGDGHDDWIKDQSGKPVLYIVAPVVPTEEPSEEATPDEPTIAPTEEPITGSDYFLIGSFSGWKVLPQYNFAHSVTDEDVEEYVITVQLEEGATFKAVKGNKEAWYPDGTGNDCKAEVAGEYTIYLRPNGDGHDDWIKDQSGKPVLYIVAPVVPTEEPSEKPSEEPTTEPTAEPTVEPTDEPITGSDYFLVGSFSEWEVLPQYNFAHSANEEGADEYVITVQLEEGATFKAVKGNKEAWYPDGMGNDCKAEVAGEYTIYLRPNGDGHDDWIKDQAGKPVLYIVAPVVPTEEPSEKPSEEPTAEPTVEPTDEPITGSDYFLVGSFSEWEVKPQYNFAHNENEDGAEEYKIAVQLKKGDEFKAVKGDKEAWYPDGENNNYVCDADGEYTVYLRPNGDGHDDWIKDSAGKPVMYVVAPSAGDSYLLGDADGNNKISILDATTIQKVLASIPVEKYDADAANVDGGAKVTILDATYVQRYLASIPTPYAIGERVERG